MSSAAPQIVVMGVSGSGKSLIGSSLAARLGWRFVDADDLHPVANVTKMAAGIPLTDDDRWPWLDIVAQTLAGTGSAAVPGTGVASGTGTVVACSALRRVYRDRIRRQAPDAFFIELEGSPELLAARIGARTAHFMPSSLLASQLSTLESLAADEAGTIVSVDGTPAEVLERAVAAVEAAHPAIAP